MIFATRQQVRRAGTGCRGARIRKDDRGAWHQYCDATWASGQIALPRLLPHKNTSRGIRHLDILSPEPLEYTLAQLMLNYKLFSKFGDVAGQGKLQGRVAKTRGETDR